MHEFDFGLATHREIARELGSRLRAQRLRQLLAQDELAARAGVSTSALKTLESSGRSTVETLIRVAAALGLQADFASLFLPHAPLTIEDLERTERARERMRAPRRRAR